MVRIPGFHPGGPGSIPGVGTFRIGGSVVESSPATRGARVRFPANAFLWEANIFHAVPTLSANFRGISRMNEWINLFASRNAVFRI